MRHTILLVAAAAAAMLTGCGPVLSLHPLYTDKTTVEEPAIAGEWAEEDGTDRWIIRPQGPGYQVTVVSGTESKRYDARLVKLGETLFADVTEPSVPDLAVKGHFFVKLRLQPERLHAAALEKEWLRKQPLAFVEEGELLIVSPTTELQRFMAQHAATKEAWGDEGAMRRLR